MIIDSHSHILSPDFASRYHELTKRDQTYATLFPKPGGRIASAELLLEAMEASGINHSIAMGFGWTDPEVASEANDYLAMSASESNGRLTALCSVNPLWGTAALQEVRRCADMGIKGIGELHPDSQGFDITDRSLMRPLMDLAHSLEFPVLIHASEPVGHQYPGKGHTTPDRVYKFIKNFPENVIICAHWGGGLPFYGLMPELPGELENVYFDTAASPFLYIGDIFEIAVKTIGADKVLLGTDYPLLSHGRLLTQVNAANMDNAARTAILGGNAAALFGLTVR